LPSHFPGVTAGGAYDAAPARFSRAKAARWLMQRGWTDEDIDEFLRHLDEEVAEDQVNAKQHNMIEEAAGGRLEWRNGGAVTKDRLPRNNTQAHDAALKYAPGLAAIKIGPIGR
jgi:hypothetical protein